MALREFPCASLLRLDDVDDHSTAIAIKSGAGEPLDVVKVRFHVPGCGGETARLRNCAYARGVQVDGDTDGHGSRALEYAPVLSLFSTELLHQGIPRTFRARKKRDPRWYLEPSASGYFSWSDVWMPYFKVKWRAWTKIRS